MVARDSDGNGGSWWKTILIGIGLYVAGLVALITTGNPVLFPTVVLIGNFLAPVAYVVFFYQRQKLHEAGFGATAMSFVYGGVLGVIAASFLEPLFVQGMNPITAFIVGLIEEFVKILGVFVVVSNRPHDRVRNGVVLGAAAGMGFAALESNGYAFAAFMQSQGSLTATVMVTLLRGVLSPLGHGTWTAILAAALFRESERQDYHFNWHILGAYAIVSVLHGLWNLLPGLAGAILQNSFAGFAAQAVIGAVGLFILWRRWREGDDAGA
jgi:RsiW-degrading membrane proteinase PrsW (M82 family)